MGDDGGGVDDHGGGMGDDGGGVGDDGGLVVEWATMTGVVGGEVGNYGGEVMMLWTSVVAWAMTESWVIIGFTACLAKDSVSCFQWN